LPLPLKVNIVSLFRRPKYGRGNTHPYPVLFHDDFEDHRLVFVEHLIGLRANLRLLPRRRVKVAARCGRDDLCQVTVER
jgi:hypothetical protein